MDNNLMGAYGSWAGGLGGRPGALSFSRGDRRDVESWRQEGRAKLRELLGPLPAFAPGAAAPALPDVRVTRSYRFEDLDVEELTWQLPYGPPTEAVFLKPAGATGPLPGVVALHDHGAVKYFGKRKITRTSREVHPFIADHQDLYYGGRAWANEVARRGYAVLAHDIIPFASRRVHAGDLQGYVVRRVVSPPEEREELTPEVVADPRPEPGWDVPPGEPREAVERYNVFAGGHEEVLARSLFSAGTSLTACFVGEDLTALEVLAHRSEVDSSRLGCCGLSGGGLRTVFLAGLDDRIACAVCVGFMSTWKDFVLNRSFTHTWMLYVPQLPRFLDFPEILALRVPRPTLVLATEEDPLYTLEEMRRAGEMIGSVYGAAGASEAYGFSMYPGPHCFHQEMQGEAFAWLDRWLGAPSR
jgi:dienelactone hydrolase